jgi:septal ring-binding cell division protein DamX
VTEPRSAAKAPVQTRTTPATAAATAVATPVAVAQTAPSAQAALARATGAKPGSKNYVPPAPPTGSLTRARFTATQEWLKSAASDHYSIQLLTAGTHDVLPIEELLARAAGRNLKLSDFYVYGVKINNQQHYRLAYGLYPTRAEVTQAIKDLPPAYLQFGPYYRSVDRMRSQNHQ